MLTKRLSSPGALKRRLSMPSNFCESSARREATVPDWSSTESTPAVSWRRGVGMRTLTGMNELRNKEKESGGGDQLITCSRSRDLIATGAHRFDVERDRLGDQFADLRLIL